MRRTGRPPLDAEDESVRVTVAMPGKQYDDAYERARLARVTVPEIIRRDMRLASRREGT